MIKIQDIPTRFVIGQLTDYHRETIELKYTIWDYVNNYKGSKTDAFKSLEENINLTYGTIRNIYYSTIKIVE